MKYLFNKERRYLKEYLIERKGLSEGFANIPFDGLLNGISDSEI